MSPCYVPGPAGIPLHLLMLLMVTKGNREVNPGGHHTASIRKHLLPRRMTSGARTSSTTLNKSSECRHTCLVSDPRQKAFSLSPGWSSLNGHQTEIAAARL
ncbi:unnamed protein product [Rangifer tarandus platyrhynchus]|uniref:Secreted protein n=1 Tax=Rangifer tarandus platyrhynchus TaxID=3082113 RepID=A0ABN8ZNC7_RANTA|nr:unnamed protein product [Rangifer tarandus platyrhynchus]